MQKRPILGITMGDPFGNGPEITAQALADPEVYEMTAPFFPAWKKAGPAPFGVGACALGGEASFCYVQKVIELAMQGQVDATVTNAISKEAINMAGHHYSGHTEIYAHGTGTDRYTMMLAYGELRVVHVSTHVSLRQACDL